jgi:hypothetical protein
MAGGAAGWPESAHMRVYEGSPRQDYEEVLRSIGAFLDQRGMREIALLETADGFIVQGLAPRAGEGQPWNDPDVRIERELLTFVEEDVARFMDEALARRRAGRPPRSAVPDDFYEQALRVLGHYIDEQKPRDVLLFEQDHSFVLRLLMATRTGLRHVLAEFTRDEVAALVSRAPQMRGRAGRTYAGSA